MIELSNEQLVAIGYYFRKTTEPYDDWDWGDKDVAIWLKGRIIERYDYPCLVAMIKDFENL